MLANSGYVMTLANSIIGVGILAMPFCFQKCGIILAILLLVLSNWITRICCHYLIKTSLLTRRKSFELIGFHAFGASGKLLVELCVIGYLLGTCITYFVVVGDLGPQIVMKIFSLESEHRHLRTLLMCGVTLFCIIPLGMLKKVDSLSTVCTASIGFYVCLVIKIILESETHIIENDWEEKVVYWQPAGVLQCLPIFSMALSCQMQIFEVFTSINNQSLDKLNGIVCNSIWICTLVYIAVGFFGYVAFCAQTFSGNILMNLSPSFSSDVIRMGFVLSVAFSFPLVIFPCRASLYSLLYRKGQGDSTSYIPESKFKAITIFIVVFSLCVALMIPSVELIIGLVGSTIGVAICIMFPAACFRKIIRKDSTERNLAHFIVVSGFCLMILGTYANLLAIDERRSGSHLEMPIVDDDLIRPTQLDKTFMEEKLKGDEKLLDEKYRNMAKADANKILKVEGQNFNQTKIIIKEKHLPPPLPVEEIAHLATENNKPLINDPPLKSKPPEILPKIIVATEGHTIKNIIDEKKIIEETKIKVNDTKLQPQNIDTEAIKKDEEVAKEEYKQENEALQKTQKELEKTKDLLEKKVEELKEELVKQNQETQNLVAEKLGEVVEKFEAIERKVHQQNEDLAPAKADYASKAINESNKINKMKTNKGPIMSILTENRTLNKKPAPSENIYEQLSSKLMDKRDENGKLLNKNLPLLALLSNVSQSKINETLQAQPQIPLTQTVDDTSKKMQEKPASLANITDDRKESDKVNIENIRREILQLKSTVEETTISVVNDISDLSNHRKKRSYPLMLEVNDNCPKLSEPKN